MIGKSWEDYEVLAMLYFFYLDDDVPEVYVCSFLCMHYILRSFAHIKG